MLLVLVLFISVNYYLRSWAVRTKVGDGKMMRERKRRERGEIPLSAQKADGIGTQWNIPLSAFRKRGARVRGKKVSARQA